MTTAAERHGTLVWIRTPSCERRVEGLRVAAGLSVWSESEPVGVVWEGEEKGNPLPHPLAEQWSQYLEGLLENGAKCWKRGPKEKGWKKITPADWLDIMRKARGVLEF